VVIASLRRLLIFGWVIKLLGAFESCVYKYTERHLGLLINLPAEVAMARDERPAHCILQILIINACDGQRLRVKDSLTTRWPLIRRPTPERSQIAAVLPHSTDFLPSGTKVLVMPHYARFQMVRDCFLAKISAHCQRGVWVQLVFFFFFFFFF
jgi:hypothetical protein